MGRFIPDEDTDYIVKGERLTSTENELFKLLLKVWDDKDRYEIQELIDSINKVIK